MQNFFTTKLDLARKAKASRELSEGDLPNAGADRRPHVRRSRRGRDTFGRLAYYVFSIQRDEDYRQTGPVTDYYGVHLFSTALES